MNSYSPEAVNIADLTSSGEKISLKSGEDVSDFSVMQDGNANLVISSHQASTRQGTANFNSLRSFGHVHGSYQNSFVQ